MPDEKPTLDQAAEKAAQKESVEENVDVDSGSAEDTDSDTGTGTEEEVEAKGEEKKAKEKEEVGGAELDLTEEQYSLVRRLLDPATQKQTIELLAQATGISQGEKSTETPKTAKKHIVDEIKELMGDEFELVPPKTWAAIDKILDAKLEPIRQQYADGEAARVNRESKEATAALYSKYNDAEKYARDMVGLMESYLPSKGQSQFDFLEDMYLLSKSRRNRSSEVKNSKFVARVKANAKNEVIPSSGAVDDRQIQAGSSKRISLDEAARLAFAGKTVKR